MRNGFGWAIAVALTVASSASAPAQLHAQQGALAIHDVAVVDVVTGSVSSGQTVVIDGGRIVAVGSVGQIAIPAGAEVVDAAGKFIIPGLWDMHSHTLNR